MKLRPRSIASTTILLIFGCVGTVAAHDGASTIDPVGTLAYVMTSASHNDARCSQNPGGQQTALETYHGEDRVPVVASASKAPVGVIPVGIETTTMPPAKK